MTCTYHIEVEVGAHLGQLSVVANELLDVVVRTEKTELLSAPESETDCVLDAEVGQGEGRVQNTNNTGAVIAIINVRSCR